MNLSNATLNLLDDFAQSADFTVNTAGQHIRDTTLKSFNIELKSDGSPVTDVDKKTEDIIREFISDRYPDHGILGEEGQAVAPEAE